MGKKVGLKDIVANEDLAPQESIFTGETTDDYRAAQESEVFFTGKDRTESFNGAFVSNKKYGEVQSYICELMEN